MVFFGLGVARVPSAAVASSTQRPRLHLQRALGVTPAVAAVSAILIPAPGSPTETIRELCLRDAAAPGEAL